MYSSRLTTDIVPLGNGLSCASNLLLVALPVHNNSLLPQSTIAVPKRGTYISRPDLKRLK
jgi:hypothetical protein